MSKTFMGVRLRRLREERKLTQTAVARALGISNSYLSQIEQNQRPLTVPLLLKLNAAFGVDVQFFSEDEEGRLISDVREALVEGGAEQISTVELRELALNMPAVGRALVGLHRKARQSADRAEAMALRLGENFDEGAPARMPFEQVRDFFYARRNHVAELDEAAERLYGAAGLSPRQVRSGLEAWLAQRHGVRVVVDEAEAALRRFDPLNRTLHVSPFTKQGQQAFQMAMQLAFLEFGDLIDDLLNAASLREVEARDLLRIGLAQYFAGAVLLPYADFLRQAEAVGYDIVRLGRHFGVGFETVCHRLSTMQRAGGQGVPFFFVRVDRAGNISKRQSATDFHFSRVGGSCPLWNVYEAFTQPGRVLTQVAQMPDGRTYLWIARTVGSPDPAYGAPGKTFAVGLGCDIRHASRLVYSHGLDMVDLSAATPIGAGCKVCERPACPQRAFPPIGRALLIDPDRSAATPYPTAAA
ncbi:MAG: short-chain fatty acyl-CoA regulator family protein [Candidatus Brevundimonas colombiensis]|jgi:predicted transcriptional regulator/DNA-binding XRE family transcriptional regulator|uniref:Short-chain fatty acyl-CoA regulator family protein n=1 Tax=Candidatus Brevundimonas colombiensis TaxID=3121376 RepID=A0AAJ5WYL7_9CAUL|nr:short-chain fatty acyl-CoA regulator family protein [Brevundimonas sp.]WEK39804.1 MAG: short-chain fatty acyl-CoA regulator family protein [Brevundimonas sp.]